MVRVCRCCLTTVGRREKEVGKVRMKMIRMKVGRKQEERRKQEESSEESWKKEV